MALIVNLPLPSGAVITNAYVDVQTLKAKRLFGGVQLIITAWNSASDKEAGKEPLAPLYKINIPESDAAYTTYFTEAVVAAEGKTDAKQGYVYIKTLDGTQTDGVALVLAGIDFTTATDA